MSSSSKKRCGNSPSAPVQAIIAKATRIAAGWLSDLTDAVLAVDRGDYPAALASLKRFGKRYTTPTAEVLKITCDDAAPIADRAVLPAFNESWDFASMHEAWLDVSASCHEWTALAPDPDSVPKFLNDGGITLGSISAIRAGMIRERARLIERERQQQQATVNGHAPKKSGRPPMFPNPSAVYDEYMGGLKAVGGLWTGQAEYLRKRHRKLWDANPRSAKSALSKLLKQQAALAERRRVS